MSIDQEFDTWPGHDAFAPDGQRIGMVDRVYTDRETGEPSFAMILTGGLNDVPKLVALDGARLHDDHVHVAFTLAMIEAAPDVDGGDALDDDEQRKLREHYVIAIDGAQEADETEVVERELLVREPTGHEAVGQATITTPIVEPT